MRNVIVPVTLVKELRSMVWFIEEVPDWLNVYNEDTNESFDE